jgi:hypothetical protein
MTKTTKILLAVSLISAGLGFTDILWGFGKPVGAIFFGLFLISKLLEKETALYDEEQRRNAALADAHAAKKADCCAGSIKAAAKLQPARVG